MPNVYVVIFCLENIVILIFSPYFLFVCPVWNRAS